MRAVIYYRVSTQRQGESGLGLEAQRHSVAQFLNRTDAIVIAEYQEVESGKNSNREVLHQAIQHTKLADATLVVAKLDRLARNIAFISKLMETKVPFVCVDMPHATPLTIHILAAIAEYEAGLISQRTKEGLAAAKRRGVKLGAHNPKVWAGISKAGGQKRASELGNKAIAKKQKERYGPLIPVIEAMRSRGDSYAKIADHLNGLGYVTVRGCQFSRTAVMRIYNRREELCVNSYNL